MRLIALELDIIHLETVDIDHFRIEPELGEGERVALKLLLYRIEMIMVDVRITYHVHELMRDEACSLRHHVEQQGVGSDIERYTEEHVCAALVHLEGKLSVGDKELKKDVAGAQRGLRGLLLVVVELARMPGRYDEAALEGFLAVLYLRDDVRYLVDRTAVGILPAPPLDAIYLPEVAREFRIRFPIVSFAVRRPYGLLTLVQLLEPVVIARAFEEPEQLALHRLKGELLGGDSREAVRHIEAHLETENGPRAGAGTILAVRAVLHDVFKGVQVGLFHRYTYTTTMEKGAFIVLDGLDGSGKATQARLLVERFEKEGISARKIDFPHYDQNLFGAFIGECLAGAHGDFVNLDPKLASIPYACDRLESSPMIREALSRGEIIVADRFTSANQIHQGGKMTDPEERAAFLTWLDRMEHEVLQVPRPDRVLYLKVPLAVSLELLAKERTTKNQAHGAGVDTVEADANYMRQSYASAEMLANENEYWVTIDCAEEGAIRSREDIHEEVWRHVQETVLLAK